VVAAARAHAMAAPPAAAAPPSGGVLSRLRRGFASIDRELLPCKLFCFWISGGQACYYAFLPLVYAQLGLRPAQVGVLTGVAPLVQAAATPLWAAAADAAGAHRAVLLSTIVAAAALHCALPACPPNLRVLLPLVVLSEAMATPISPLADAAIGLTLQVRAARPCATALLRCAAWRRKRASAQRFHAHEKAPRLVERTCVLTRRCVPLAPFQRAGKPFSEYGKQRLWGAVSWGFVFSPLVGALETLSRGRVRTLAPYVGHVACYALALDAARKLAQPTTGAQAQAQAHAAVAAADAPAGAKDAAAAEDDNDNDAVCTPRSPPQQPPPPPPPSAHEPPPGFLAVLRRITHAVRTTPGATLRLALFLLLGAVMGTIGSFLFLWLDALGGSELLDGLALTMTCVSEVAIFYYAGEIQARLGVTACLHLVIACYILRLLAYAALPALGGPWAVLPVQLLHGVTFGLYWAVGNAFARAIAPRGLESSMQGLFAGLNSAGSCLGNVAAGAIVQRHGYRALFLGMAAALAGAQAALTASAARERWSASGGGGGGVGGARGGGGVCEAAGYARLSLDEEEEDGDDDAAGAKAAEDETEAEAEEEEEARSTQ
jgi:MFS family permease